MYSLDQVIYFLEKRQQTEDWNIRDAAIAYLKEYRDEYNNIINVHDDYVNLRNEMAEELSKRNPPLTQEELNQMIGKPVWVHEYDQIDNTKGWHRCRWYLVNFVNDTYFYVCDMDGEENYFDLSDYGKTWTAYRKEKRS